VGLIEVDVGSVRSGGVNQAEVDRRLLSGHFSSYECKYGEESLNQLLPILRKQANAFLAAPSIVGERFHYFDTGIKRLILELELDGVIIFLVHLSLKYRHRQEQLRSPLRTHIEGKEAGHRCRRLQHLLGRERNVPVHEGRWPAQRQRGRTAFLSQQITAHGTRFCAVW
jgi:endonuclease/exonuclease/phosphatase family metal-dependent hydrolase